MPDHSCIRWRRCTWYKASDSLAADQRWRRGARRGMRRTRCRPDGHVVRRRRASSGGRWSSFFAIFRWCPHRRCGRSTGVRANWRRRCGASSTGWSNGSDRIPIGTADCRSDVANASMGVVVGAARALTMPMSIAAAIGLFCCQTQLSGLSKVQ